MATQAYFRRVIKIRAEDSPNVQAGIKAMQLGQLNPSPLLLNTPEQPWGVFSQQEFDEARSRYERNQRRGMVLTGLSDPALQKIPGVITFQEYLERRRTWDKIRQCVGLDAEFYEGAEVMLFPPQWLDRSHHIAETVRGKQGRKAKAMGCDPGEGGASSSWVVGDELGILEVYSVKTPDTTAVPTITLMLMRKWNIPEESVAMDRGGGGKQHADYLEQYHGINIQTVAFGESPTIEPRRSLIQVEEKIDTRHEKYAFINVRAEMYWRAREYLDPALNPSGYGIPAEYTMLRSELAPIPMQLGSEETGQWSCWDQEGRFRLPPKNRRNTGVRGERQVCLVDLIGHSPDEADAFVLMLHALQNAENIVPAGVM